MKDKLLLHKYGAHHTITYIKDNDVIVGCGGSIAEAVKDLTDYIENKFDYKPDTIIAEADSLEAFKTNFPEYFI